MSNLVVAGILFAAAGFDAAGAIDRAIGHKPGVGWGIGTAIFVFGLALINVAAWVRGPSRDNEQ
jgi:hypothetical protein